MRFLVFLSLFLLHNAMYGQSIKSLDFKIQEGEKYAFSLDSSAIYSFTSIAVLFEKNAAPNQVLIRSKSEYSNWSPWKTIPLNAHNNKDRVSFGQIFIEAPNNIFELSTEGAHSFEGNIQMYSPSEFKETSSSKNLKPVISEGHNFSEKSPNCSCPQPNYIDRGGWGGPPNQQAGCTPNYTTVTHMVVHHEASTPIPPYAAAVKSIWQFHTANQGWCDIAYNWLIAPDGVLYEGRAGGDNVVGAHFCGDNGGTVGVCLLGNFEVEEPTQAALTTLEELLAWKACTEGITPDSISLHATSGIELPHIVGHRLGCATLCPGVALFDKLPNVQAKVKLLYEDPTGCDGIYPPSNDQCSEAIQMLSGTSCTYISADLEGATPSGLPIPTCTGFTSPTALDVWFNFTANSTTESITVEPNSMNLAGIDPVIALYEGACESLSLIECSDSPGGAGGNGNLTVSNLIIGKEYWLRVFDFGSTAPADPTFDICIQHQTVGTSELSELSQFKLFPNPAKEYFMLESPEPIDLIQVYDALGRLIFSEKNSNKKHLQIKCSTWATGFYTIKALNSKNQVETLIFLKQ